MQEDLPIAPLRNLSLESSSFSLRSSTPTMPPRENYLSATSESPNTFITRQISNTNSRHNTPSQHINHHPSPLRQSSAARCNSASKIRNLSKAIFEAQSSNNLNNRRSLSTRKQRQYENNNLYGVHKYMNYDAKNSIDESDEVIQDGDGFVSSILKKAIHTIDCRSTIGKLFDKQDIDTLEIIRKCKDFESLQNLKFHDNLNIPKHLSNWIEGHRAWLNIERKLRDVVYLALKKDKSLLSLISDIEQVLVHYAHTKAILDVTQSNLNDHLDSEIKATDTGIHFHLKDSRMIRLLLHTAAKFYGFQSKSNQIEEKKYLVISLSKRISTSVEKNISMYGYLNASLHTDDK